MLICACRAVLECEIRTAVAEGAATLDDLERVCGAGADCGECQPELEALIHGEEVRRTEGEECRAT
jgi:bacterioferritin-associated ferredoxin